MHIVARFCVHVWNCSDLPDLQCMLSYDGYASNSVMSGPMASYARPMPDAQCPIADARCPMPNARLPMPDARCPMPDA